MSSVNTDIMASSEDPGSLASSTSVEPGSLASSTFVEPGSLASPKVSNCAENGSLASSETSSQGDSGSLASRIPRSNESNDNVATSNRTTRRSSSRGPKCLICSGKGVIGYVTRNVYHRHFSSKFMRECIDVEGKGRLHFCPTCKVDHKSELADSKKRLKICLSSSTLHEFWEPSDSSLQYEGDSTHIDWVTMSGARISQLTAAWELQYLNETRPMDVLVVGGLDNIIRGQTGPSIVKALEHLVDLIVWQGRSHPEEPNTCAIATLPYPPRICWLKENEEAPTNFDNQLRNIKWLNRKIEEINLKSGVKVPKFHSFGVRKMTRFGKQTTKHRPEHWREDGMELSDDQRIKLGRQVGRFFLHETAN